jgi:hypothetical protein
LESQRSNPKKEIMKNPIKVMLIIVIILLVASIIMNVIQANKMKKCTCTDEADATTVLGTNPTAAPAV